MWKMKLFFFISGQSSMFHFKCLPCLHGWTTSLILVLTGRVYGVYGCMSNCVRFAIYQLAIHTVSLRFNKPTSLPERQSPEVHEGRKAYLTRAHYFVILSETYGRSRAAWPAIKLRPLCIQDVYIQKAWL